MTEADAFDLVKNLRWLRAVITQVENDYQTLVDGNMIKPIEGLTEFSHLPVFMDLAYELVGTALKIAETAMEAFE